MSMCVDLPLAATRLSLDNHIWHTYSSWIEEQWLVAGIQILKLKLHCVMQNSKAGASNLGAVMPGVECIVLTTVQTAAAVSFV